VIIVSNTSPITNLAAVGQLDLLQQLYSQIIISQVVYDEMAGLDYAIPGTREVQALSWIQTQQVQERALLEKRSVPYRHRVSLGALAQCPC
jgi:predicted nucleic acid-binding protein